MPTGYTHDVQTGKITTLRDFALLCARGMGACIMMRDDPWDAPIPERFEPSDYSSKKLAEAQANLDELVALSRDECSKRAAADHEEGLAEFAKRVADRAAERKRYEDMIAQVEAWRTDAEGIREFMLQQLRQSIDFDCSPIDEDCPFIGKPKALTGEEWRNAQVKKATKDIAYHSQAHAEEVARTESRNRWLADLRASLPAETAAA